MVRAPSTLGISQSSMAVFMYTIQSHFSAMLIQVRHVDYSDLHDLSHTNNYSITFSGCHPLIARLLRHVL